MSQGLDAVEDMTLGKDKGESSQEVYRAPGEVVDAWGEEWRESRTLRAQDGLSGTQSALGDDHDAL